MLSLLTRDELLAAIERTNEPGLLELREVVQLGSAAASLRVAFDKGEGALGSHGLQPSEILA